MGTHSLTSSNTIGITLSADGSYLTPFTVTSTGNINTGDIGVTIDAISSAITSDIANYGTLIAANYGILLKSGGSVYNAGLIYAYNTDGAVQTGIGAVGYATVDNTGTIVSHNYALNFLDGGFVINSGTIDGTYNGGVQLQAAGTVANESSGSIDGVALDAQGTVLNAGQIDATNGDSSLVMEFGGYLSNASTGTVAGNNYYGIYIETSNATIINAGTIFGNDGGINDNHFYGENDELNSAAMDIRNSGLIESGTSTSAIGIHIGYSTEIETVQNSGTIESGNGASGIALEVSSAALHLILDAGATFIGAVEADQASANLLELASSSSTGTISGIGSTFTGFESIAIDSNAAWVLSGDSAGLANHEVITGFNTADTIDLMGFSTSSYHFADGVLTLSNVGATEYLTLSALGSITTPDFVVHSTTTETEITEDVPCFCIGTHIATPRGNIPVEALKIGDFVKTLHAGAQKIRWIGTRSYAAPFANHPAVLPVCIKPGAIGNNVPARTLWVSPGHAICINGVLVHAARLINGVSVVQADHVENVTYYHIELETHEVIFAEGCPAETFRDEHFRRQFHNAAAFHALYPEHETSQTACLPRLDHGFALQAIQRRLNARAGIFTPPAAGALRGYIDQAGPEICTGWAQDISAPETSVCLDILESGRRVGRVLANLYRADLRMAGMGSGCHGFEFLRPPGATGLIKVQRAADGTILPLTTAAIQEAA